MIVIPIASWTEFKNLVAGKSLAPQWYETADTYEVQAVEDGIYLWQSALLKGSSDATDFETYYQDIWNVPLDKVGGLRHVPTFIEWTTASYPSLHFKESDNSTDISDAAISYWNSGIELKRSDYGSDGAFQTALTTNCNHTRVDWTPVYAWKSRQSALMVGTSPSTPTYLFITYDPTGANVSSNSGGLPIHLIASKSIMSWQGVPIRTSPANKTVRFDVFHTTGVQVNLAVAVQLFR